MPHYEVMRKFETKNFTVIVDATEDEDLDLSFDEDGSTAEGLRNGELIAFLARARVLFQGKEIASDYLGGCIYRNFDSFMDHRACWAQNRNNQANGIYGTCGSYFSDMIATVCSEARKAMLDMQSIHVRKMVA